MSGTKSRAAEQQAPVAILWHHVHVRLVMLAEGTTSSYNGAGAHQKPGSKAPPAVDRDVVDLELRWEGCASDKDRRGVLRDGIALIRLHRPKALSRRRDTLEWKQAIANDPRSSRVVAEMYDVSHWTVCDYRKKHGAKQAA